MSTRRQWHPAEHAALMAMYPHMSTKVVAAILDRPVSSVYQRALSHGQKKDDAYLASPAACRLRAGDVRGAAFRFTKGQKSWNEGTKGVMKPNRTSFPKGHRPHTWRPVGSERVLEDGYLQIKVTDTGYTPRDWRMVHVLVWEDWNGPLPKGCVIVFRNRDKTDIRLENLECVTRQQLMKRNTVHNLPKPLAQVVQLRGALQRQINKRSKA